MKYKLVVHLSNTGFTTIIVKFLLLQRNNNAIILSLNDFSEKRLYMITAIIGSVLILAIAILYLMLILGYPYGEYAMGGKHSVFPKSMKIMSVVAIIIQIVMILILLQAGQVIDLGLSTQIVKTAGFCFAIYLTINILMNSISRSKKERFLMTPLSLIITTCYWITILNL